MRAAPSPGPAAHPAPTADGTGTTALKPRPNQVAHPCRRATHSTRGPPAEIQTEIHSYG